MVSFWNDRIGRVLRCAIIIMTVVLIAACGGPAEKKAKFFSKGKELYEKGDYVKAGLEFKNAIQIDLKYADAYYMLGMVELRKGNPKGAMGNYAKAVELEPNNINARIQIARLYIGGQAPDRAQESVEAVLKVDPKNDEALILKGAALLAVNEAAKAREFLQRLLEQGIREPDVYLLLASTYSKSGDINAAENILRIGLAANPRNDELRLQAARFCILRARFKEAGRYVNEVIKESPGNVDAHFIKGRVYLALGEGGSAITEFRIVVTERPQFIPAQISLAEAHAMNREFAPAIALLEKRLLENPLDPFPYRLLGQVYLAQRNPAKADEAFRNAIHAYEKIVEKQPNLWGAVNDLAYMLGEYGRKSSDLDRALTLAHKAQAAMPDEVSFLDTLGWLHYKKGGKAMAIEMLTKAQVKAPEAPIINSHLGMALYKAGKTEEARGYLQKALRSPGEYPGREEAWRTLQKL